MKLTSLISLNTLTALELVISTKWLSLILLVPVEVTGDNIDAIDDTNITKIQKYK